MITAQKIGHEEVCQVDSTELYEKDVHIISKNGKLYYLPETDIL